MKKIKLLLVLFWIIATFVAYYWLKVFEIINAYLR